jgi:hypothetical protein
VTADSDEVGNGATVISGVAGTIISVSERNVQALVRGSGVKARLILPLL